MESDKLSPKQIAAKITSISNHYYNEFMMDFITHSLFNMMVMFMNMFIKNPKDLIKALLDQWSNACENQILMDAKNIYSDNKHNYISESVYKEAAMKAYREVRAYVEKNFEDYLTKDSGLIDLQGNQIVFKEKNNKDGK